MRSILLAAAASSALASCAVAPRAMSPNEASVVLGNRDTAKSPFSATARTRLTMPFPVQRAAMVADIRADLRKQAASADTPAFERALKVLAALPRERFVLPAGRRFAYIDLPQQIGWRQTISDPYIVALMTAQLDLRPDANVLDVGTGSGYQAAVLSSLAARVSSIEIVDPLARSAAARLKALGYRNVEVRSGDGFAGWPEHAPFDGIVVAAGAAEVPAPLLAQLKPGGRLVMPIGPSDFQEQILAVTKKPDGSTSRCSLGWAMFVPLTGRGRTQAGNQGLADRTIPLCYGAEVS